VFTGIVQEVGRVITVTGKGLSVAAQKVCEGLEPGGSMAVNGVCLTVTAFNDKSFSVEVMPETLSKTNLGMLHTGDAVNLERPLALGGELGGHLVQGHIDDTGRIASITKEGEAVRIRFEAAPEVMRFIVEKGFIAVDGTSLTVVDKVADSFGVSIVGFTRENTILAGKKIGDLVNLEVDIIGKYVAEYNKPPETGITIGFLQEHGFPVE
jgi:riboflavin synthase